MMCVGRADCLKGWPVSTVDQTVKASFDQLCLVLSIVSCFKGFCYWVPKREKERKKEKSWKQTSSRLRNILKGTLPKTL